MSSHNYDVVILGGGPAGLSAALTLSRARRRVLVVDAGEPRNAPAEHAHNYLGREGIPPLELLSIGRAEVVGYGGTVRTGTVSSVERLDGGGFRVSLVDEPTSAAGSAESTVDARRLLVATGLVDELPAIPGVAQRWGRDVLHCPYCHGWEVRDQSVGIVGSGAGSIHQALLWRQWTDKVTLFTNEVVVLGEESRAELAAREIAVVDGAIDRLEVVEDRLTGVRLADGSVVDIANVVVLPRSVARVDMLAKLGLHATEQRMGEQVLGTALPALDPNGATGEPGVWVAGNATDFRAQVIVAAAEGLMAAAMINNDLMNEDTKLAIAAHDAA